MNLAIEREKCLKFLNSLKESYESFTINIEKNKVSVSFVNEGNKHCFCVFFKSGGKTTLQAQGKEIPKKFVEENIFNPLVEDCCFGNVKSVNYCLSNVSEEKVTNLLSTLKDIGYFEFHKTRDESSKKTQYRVTSKADSNASTTLEIYDTRTLCIKGLTNITYMQIYPLLAKTIPEIYQSALDDIKTESNGIQYCKSKFSQSFQQLIGRELDDFLPSVAPAFLIHTGIIKSKNITDYAFAIFPIQRGLEWFIKHLLVTKNIINKSDYNKFNFGDLFLVERENSELSIHIKSSMLEEFEKDALKSLYEFHYKYRNDLFHLDRILSLQYTINSLKEAKTFVDNAVEAMNGSAKKWLRNT